MQRLFSSSALQFGKMDASASIFRLKRARDQVCTSPASGGHPIPGGDSRSASYPRITEGVGDKDESRRGLKVGSVREDWLRHSGSCRCRRLPVVPRNGSSEAPAASPVTAPALLRLLIQCSASIRVPMFVCY